MIINAVIISQCNASHSGKQRYDSREEAWSLKVLTLRLMYIKLEMVVSLKYVCNVLSKYSVSLIKSMNGRITQLAITSVCLHILKFALFCLGHKAIYLSTVEIFECIIDLG